MAIAVDPRERAAELLPGIEDAIKTALEGAEKIKHVSCQHCGASVRAPIPDVQALTTLWNTVVSHKYWKPSEMVKHEAGDGVKGEIAAALAGLAIAGAGARDRLTASSDPPALVERTQT